ncbi:unnamed protein product [Spirodela intermedia]|uniref:HMA domain-containing protein n=1 Tax=Spirodela intermedia TaxID=51605 RepID=A0A7I8IWN7_SPIIN|nr:unnamed protein product [Spirodela intermedia]CAA6662230.1 unnamed protein product [Spirodela intermedia]
MVFKISIYCGKCKTAILKAIAKLEGIDEIQLNIEKGTVTVVGEVDPVCVAHQLRKVRRPAVLDSVGPHKKEEPKPKPKELPPAASAAEGIPSSLRNTRQAAQSSEEEGENGENERWEDGGRLPGL